MSLKIRAYGRSDVGQVRRRNEDTLAVDAALGIVVVADGMGGAPAGDLASSTAVQKVTQALRAGEGIVDSVRGANRHLFDMADSEPGLLGMGTTMTALKVSLPERSYRVGHVGDSRAYLLSGGEFTQISRDHTMVRDMVEAGKIPESAERKHPLGHILSRVLGTEDVVEVDLVEGPIQEGDCFLLCSDGLTKVMDDDEVGEWVRRIGSQPMEELVDAMIQEGNTRGAPDNITVALLQVANNSSS